MYIIENFTLVATEELIKIISCLKKTTCASDPFPVRLLMSHLPIIDVILHIVNLYITTNVVLLHCKSSIVTSLIKKPGLDAEIKKKQTIDLYQICLFYLKSLKKSRYLVFFAY